jgi:AAA15 family ATPase/GTPase
LVTKNKAKTKARKKSKSVAATAAARKKKKKSKTTPHFKFKSDTEVNIQNRHQEALKAGFQIAEEYETFLRQKEARKLAGEPEPRVPATIISEETVTKEAAVVATTNEY